jgi:hypothetical protein
MYLEEKECGSLSRFFPQQNNSGTFLQPNRLNMRVRPVREPASGDPATAAGSILNGSLN